MRQLAQKNIKRRWVWLLLALVVAARLSIALSQRIYLLPQQSGLDDMLMLRAAYSLTEGGWLGPYTGFAIAKNMGFALWLALLHALGIPLLVGNALLWLFCCAFAVWALRPVLPGNLMRLCVFAFFAFQPVSFAGFTQRVYRDSIFPALSLLFFAGVLGLGLRLSQPRARGSVVAALGAGLGLAAAWLVREDGLLLLVFALCGLAAIGVFALFSRQTRRRLVKLACALLPFAVLLAGIAGFGAANKAKYGVFVVSDLTSGSFSAAYGAMAAVSLAESGYTRYTPVTRAALEKLYAEAPSLALLRPSLASGPAYNGFANLATGEYGGSFYYALRLAATYEGLTPTAPAAQLYWARVEAEIQSAVAEGRLQSEKPNASTVPAFSAQLASPAALETGKGFLAVLTLQNCDPRPAISQGDAADILAAENYLHSSVQYAYEEGSDLPYYNPFQKLCFLLCDVLIWLYRILLWPLLALALFLLGWGLARDIRRAFSQKCLPPQLLGAVLLLGLLLSFLLRLAVTAYMEVAAFGIGTSLMYLSAGVPALLLFCAAAPFALGGEKAADPERRENF
ncbi:MAG: hypothetical protein ACK5L3_10095 [Oscillospiraceae bacterium]